MADSPIGVGISKTYYDDATYYTTPSTGSSTGYIWYHPDTGIWYPSDSVTQAGAITPPIWNNGGKSFLGYYYNNSQVISSSGVISRIPSSTETGWEVWTDRWENKTATLTFDPQGGTVSESSRSVIYSVALGTLPTPTRTGYKFLGWFKETTYENEISSTTTYWSGSDSTVYAKWEAMSYITFDAQGGTVSTAGKYVAYGDALGDLPTPTRTDYYFDGWYTAASGGTLVDSSTVSPWSADATIYAHWTQIEQYTLTFDPDGGSVSPTSKIIVYGATFGTLPTPTRYACTFDGWYDSDGTLYTSSSVYSVHADMTVYAHWSVDPTYSRTLNFNAQGGTVSPSTKSCVYGESIGSMPTPTKTDKKFAGWYSSTGGSGTLYTESSTCDWSDTKTLYAYWVDSFFGTVTDYFSIASSNLIPESSDSGDTHQHTCAYNATSESPATETSGIWRNPRVTYRVVGQMTLAVTIGAAFKAVNSGTSIPTISGYMISSVEVHTAVGEAPSVTVSAVANEGYTARQSGTTTYYTAAATPAIKTYAVSIPISPRHRPQNLLSAISGGGELQELTLVARGDPVVLAENGMPCASDMTHGRIEVTARTAAYNNETAPTASNSFTKTAEPQSNSGTGYKTFSVTVRKELT